MRIPPGSILVNAERGLFAIEIDPFFNDNGYFYLMCPKDMGGGVQRMTVSRFSGESGGGDDKVPDSAAILAGETVLWRNMTRSTILITRAVVLPLGGARRTEGRAGHPHSADREHFKVFITTGEEFVETNSKTLRIRTGRRTGSISMGRSPPTTRSATPPRREATTSPTQHPPCITAG